MGKAKHKRNVKVVRHAQLAHNVLFAMPIAPTLVYQHGYQLCEKAEDIVGLYVAPPANAIVLCMDEKPCIQALERKTGSLKTESGKVIRA